MLNQLHHIRAGYAGWATIRKIRHPELIRSISLELPVDSVQRTRRGHIEQRRANTLTANCATQALQFHQPSDRAERHTPIAKARRVSRGRSVSTDREVA